MSRTALAASHTSAFDTSDDHADRHAGANHRTPIRTFLIGLGLSIPLRGRFRRNFFHSAVTASSAVHTRVLKRGARKNILSWTENGASRDLRKILISSSVFESAPTMSRDGDGCVLDAAKRRRCRLRMRDQATRSAELRTQNEGVTVFFIALV